jgi:diguanylate cyclase (GGDEF)-like protein
MATKPAIREGTERDPPSFGLAPSYFAGNRRALRVLFLLPLLVATLVMAGATNYLEYRQGEAHRQYEVRNAFHGLLRFYREQLAGKAQMLGAVAEILRQDEGLREGLARRDREGLLPRAAPMFERLKLKYAITHLYFMAPDRSVIARSHIPDRYGDVISRQTLQQADATGRESWGVELGPLGTLVLRFVLPVELGERRIGFIETGMEIDAILQSLTGLADDRVFLFLSKQRLNRPDWEQGMAMLGRVPQWERFPDYVLSAFGDPDLPPEVERFFLSQQQTGGSPALERTESEGSRHAVFMPLNDAAGEVVGTLVAVLDRSDYERYSHRLFVGMILAILIVAVILVGLFLALLGRIGRQLEQHEVLRNLAIRDGLTELLNRRAFVSLLESELADARRSGRALSLLMVDVDHFKDINDMHGHPTGDRVLKSLCERVLQQVRTADWVCRYGGEEISVILPDTDAATAFHIGERIRQAIGAHPFAIEPGVRFPLTVSIGVAAAGHATHEPARLVEAADAALYRAKQSERNRVCVAA